MCNKAVPYICMGCVQTSIDDKHRGKKSPSFGICCNHGQVQLPEWPDFPEPLRRLLYSQDEDAIHFRANIRTYNSALQMASTGAQVDYGSMGSNGNFRISGSVYHRIGPLLPVADQPPKFAQLYLVDSEHELQNRMKAFDKDGKKDDRGMRPHILEALQSMLHNCNHFVRKFKEAAAAEDTQDGMLVLRAADGKCYRLCFCLRITLCFCLLQPLQRLCICN